MNVVDFTQKLLPDMTVFPGTPRPELEKAALLERDGYRETALRLYSHHGTHMDAPAHILPRGQTLDALPPERFIGTALVIDCSDARPGAVLGLERIAPVRELADQADFLLLRTDWDRFWGTPAYLEQYPVMGEDLADYLAAYGKKGVGLDVISADAMGAALPCHRRLLAAGVLIVENLTALKQADEGLFTFCALPLHYGDADGAPVRAIGILENILLD